MTTRDLLGRRTECAALDQLVTSVRSGPSRALVLRGEAGVGKSALLGYLMQHAPGCGIVRAAGVESELELAFAGLQRLLGYGSPLSRSPSREYRREVSGVAAARATTDACPTISVACRARVIAV